MAVTVTDHDWAWLDAWLREAFGSRRRRLGEQMALHSIRIGRALRRDGCDAITVFGGYCHDIVEDTDVTAGALLPVALRVLRDAADAEAAVALVVECSYSPEEYLLPKRERKAAACARWIASPDIRVALVKKADVEDNRADAPNVSGAFAAEYMSWAGPLHEELSRIVAASRETPRE